MKKNSVSFDPSMKNGYIPAPYVLEDGENINDFYLEPVLFHNENGPTIGVTTCGVIVQDGLYFKDIDNDGVLSAYEDWRNDPEILKNVKGGSYAYCDCDGNYYRSGFGLRY